MGGLLSFLTGLTGGSAEAIDQERKQAQQEQEQELAYRRTNLEHMVKAAEEGRVNPEMVGRVYEEYMNSMQGLSGRPMAKGRAGFAGKKDLGQNSLLRELATGAVGLFGPQPGSLNIDWGAAKPQQQVGGPTGMAGVPSIPNFQTPGKPVEQVINEGYGAAMPPAGGGWLIKHPDTLAMEGGQQDLLKTLTGDRARNMLEVAKLQELYGKQHPYEDRYDGSSRSSVTHTNIAPRFNEATGQWENWGFNKATRQFEQIAGGEGLIPASAISTVFNDSGAGTPVVKGTAVPAGTGRTTPPRNPLNPPQPTGERLADDTVRFVYDDIMKRAKDDFSYDIVSADKKLEIERKAYDTHAPANVKAEFPTWDDFKKRRAVRVTPTPVSAGTSSDMDDEALLKAIAADLAKRNTPPQSAPIK